MQPPCQETLGHPKIDFPRAARQSSSSERPIASLRADLIAGGEQRASWVADNYNHLMEQPTLFYAVALTLGFTGWGNGANAIIAWAFVALRVIHSLVQILSNRVIVRFVIFMLSSLCLVALTLHSAMAVFHV